MKAVGVAALVLLFACHHGKENSAQATCPPSEEAETARAVDATLGLASWVERPVYITLREPGFDSTRIASADDATVATIIAEREEQLAPLYAPIVERLAAVGASDVRTSWLTASVAAVVRARHMKEIPCWPEVVSIRVNDMLLCVGVCTYDCERQPNQACGACTTVRGDRVDRERGCRVEGLPIACASASREDLLTCYVRPSTGEMFASRDASLASLGAPDLRLCTREEGGDQDPTSLPRCP